MTYRWQRLKVYTGSPRSVPFRQAIEYYQETLGWDPFDCCVDQCLWNLYMRIRDRLEALLLLHFEYSDGCLDRETLLKEAIDTGIHYFWSDWSPYFPPNTRVPSPETRRNSYLWLSAYRDMLLICLVSDSEHLERLLGWPSDDLPVPDFNRLTADDAAVYTYLSRLLKGDQDAPPRELKRHKMNDAITAITSRDGEAFQTALTEFLRSHRMLERPSDSLTEFVSLDGSILYHVAKRLGVSVPQLTTDLDDLVLQ